MTMRGPDRPSYGQDRPKHASAGTRRSVPAPERVSQSLVLLLGTVSPNRVIRRMYVAFLWKRLARLVHTGSLSGVSASGINPTKRRSGAGGGCVAAGKVAARR